MEVSVSMERLREALWGPVAAALGAVQDLGLVPAAGPEQALAGAEPPRIADLLDKHTQLVAGPPGHVGEPAEPAPEGVPPRARVQGVLRRRDRPAPAAPPRRVALQAPPEGGPPDEPQRLRQAAPPGAHDAVPAALSPARPGALGSPPGVSRDPGPRPLGVGGLLASVVAPQGPGAALEASAPPGAAVDHRDEIGVKGPRAWRASDAPTQPSALGVGRDSAPRGEEAPPRLRPTGGSLGGVSALALDPEPVEAAPGVAWPLPARFGSAPDEAGFTSAAGRGPLEPVQSVAWPRTSRAAVAPVEEPPVRLQPDPQAGWPEGPAPAVAGVVAPGSEGTASALRWAVEPTQGGPVGPAPDGQAAPGGPPPHTVWPTRPAEVEEPTGGGGNDTAPRRHGELDSTGLNPLRGVAVRARALPIPLTVRPPSGPIGTDLGATTRALAGTPQPSHTSPAPGGAPAAPPSGPLGPPVGSAPGTLAFPTTPTATAPPPRAAGADAALPPAPLDPVHLEQTLTELLQQALEREGVEVWP